MADKPNTYRASTPGADGSRRLFDAAMGAANTEQEFVVMAEDKSSAAAPRGWDVAETSVPGSEGLLQEVTGRDGQRDSTADQDRTNDAPRQRMVEVTPAERPQQQNTQDRVAEAAKDVRSGNVGVTKAMSQLQEKLDERNQDRGQERGRGGRDR